MDNMNNLTVPEKLLLAAENLHNLGNIAFTVHSLTVAAWQRFPDAFGLAGFAGKYPDHNKVVSALCGKKGLVHRGWFVRKAANTYALTPVGLARISAAQPPARKAKRSEQRIFLDRLASSVAAGTGRNQLTFSMACDFFDVAGGKHMERIEETTQKLTELAESDDEEMAGKARVLRSLAAYLIERHEKHFKIMWNWNRKAS